MRMPTAAPASAMNIALKPCPGLDRGTGYLRSGEGRRRISLPGACPSGCSREAISGILPCSYPSRDPVMMIVGIGVDLVEIARVDRVLRRHPERARTRLFTPGEIAYCDAASRPPQSYAARFAVKEAFFKAVGTGWGRVRSRGCRDGRRGCHRGGARPARRRWS